MSTLWLLTLKSWGCGGVSLNYSVLPCFYVCLPDADIVPRSKHYLIVFHIVRCATFTFFHDCDHESQAFTFQGQPCICRGKNQPGIGGALRLPFCGISPGLPLPLGGTKPLAWSEGGDPLPFSSTMLGIYKAICSVLFMPCPRQIAYTPLFHAQRTAFRRVQPNNITPFWHCLS